MVRRRPHNHWRHYKSGKSRLVNPMIPKRRKRKNFGSLDTDISKYAREAHLRLIPTEKLDLYLQEQNEIVTEYAKEHKIPNIENAYQQWIKKGYAEEFAKEYRNYSSFARRHSKIIKT